jgi:hypothetical protein
MVHMMFSYGLWVRTSSCGGTQTNDTSMALHGYHEAGPGRFLDKGFVCSIAEG